MSCPSLRLASVVCRFLSLVSSRRTRRDTTTLPSPNGSSPRIHHQLHSPRTDPEDRQSPESPQGQANQQRTCPRANQPDSNETLLRAIKDLIERNAPPAPSPKAKGKTPQPPTRGHGGRNPDPHLGGRPVPLRRDRRATSRGGTDHRRGSHQRTRRSPDRDPRRATRPRHVRPEHFDARVPVLERGLGPGAGHQLLGPPLARGHLPGASLGNQNDPAARSWGNRFHLGDGPPASSHHGVFTGAPKSVP